MDHEIRPLTQKEELAAYARIAFDAYPGFEMEDVSRLESYLVKIAEKAGNVRPMGAFRNGVLTGGMLVYDYSMNYRDVFLPVGGVGLVAVDLLHKKEHVCKDLVTSFILESRKRGRMLTLLYPFRPDFYYKMGYGYGAPLYEYRVRTENFIKDSSKEGLEHATAEDREAVVSCYNRVAALTHGMIKRSGADMGRIMAKKGHHAVVVLEKGEVTGYVIYMFQSAHKNNFVVNDLVIVERMETTPQARERLNTFIGGQRDQCAHVVYRTFDAEEYHSLTDPRDPTGDLVPDVYHTSHRGAVGLMYRIGDTEGFFRETQFPAPEGWKGLALEITDTLLGEEPVTGVLTEEKGLLRFIPGKPDNGTPLIHLGVQVL
ncbi:MAG TPA: GNAT family N-acetyltransferase, partial [Firmicutes bacterium]|nr:GNAT family N-acetyltransferase [Bacillota bacterium]